MATGTQPQTAQALAKYRQAMTNETKARVEYQVREISRCSVHERGAAFTAWMEASRATTAALRELVTALELEWPEEA